MKIELRNITHNERLSEETNAYAADLWVDGRRIGQVSNHGHGGCDDFHGDEAAYRAADDWCKANLPPFVTDYSRMGMSPDEVASLEAQAGAAPMPQDIEMHCASLLQRWLEEREVKKTLRTHVLYFAAAKPSEIYEIKINAKAGKTAAGIIANLKARNPTATVLNEMPLADAIDALNKAL